MSPRRTSGGTSAARLRLRLVGLSFLMLFLELALIRWAASNNIHLAYLTNFVLLASFLGIGIGFLRVRRSPDLFPFTPLALAAMVAFVALFPVVLTNEGDLGGRVRHGAAAPMGHADGPLRAHRRGDGVHRAGRRPGLRAVRSARGLPPRHPGQHRRHRRVLGAGLPAAAADRVGLHRRRAARRAARVATAAARPPRGRGRARDPVGCS